MIKASIQQRRNELKNAKLETCAICLDEIGNNYVKIMPCAHIFHESCLSNLFRNTGSHYRCPLCRKDIEYSINQNGSILPPVLIDNEFFHTITALPHLQHLSLEELRMMDYMNNR